MSQHDNGTTLCCQNEMFENEVIHLLGDKKQDNASRFSNHRSGRPLVVRNATRHWKASQVSLGLSKSDFYLE